MVDFPWTTGSKHFEVDSFEQQPSFHIILPCTRYKPCQLQAENIYWKLHAAFLDPFNAFAKEKLLQLDVLLVKLLPYPPYSPDLNPRYYFKFSDLKKLPGSNLTLLNSYYKDKNTLE